MKTNPCWLWLASIVFLCGCASIKAGGDVAVGRQEMFKGNNEAALGYFQSAWQADPNYKYGTAYQQGLLSYVGRTEHAGLNVLQTSFAIMAGGEISLSDGTGNPIFTHGGFRETKEADDEGSKDS